MMGSLSFLQAEGIIKLSAEHKLPTDKARFFLKLCNWSCFFEWFMQSSCLLFMLPMSMGAFTYDVRCLGGNFDLPT